jgi:F-type H+-transporting ATPase subunit a
MTPALLCLLATLGAEPPAGAHVDISQDVVQAAMKHVTDSRTMDLQLPWGAPHEYTWPAWQVPLGSHTLDLSITKHVFFMWVAVLLLLLVVLPSSRPRQPGESPHGLSGVVEAFVLGVRGIAITTIGKHDADRYVPYLCSIAGFILFCGLVGVLPFTATATGNLAVTGALALCTLALTLAAGMRSKGVVGYWTHLVPKGVPLALYPLMIPVEILSIFTKPFALTVRLFANMIAGHLMIVILLGLTFIMGTLVIAPVAVVVSVAVYALDLMILGIQTLIFTLLSATFIGMAAHEH